jgi:4-hydroxythreonine-4-phosphate dehydrogenase
MIAVSMGDARGVGPEVVVAALADPRAPRAVVFGDRAALERAAALRSVAVPERIVQTAGGALEYVDAALDAVLAGAARGLCTAPLSKERVAALRPEFVGHTEHLAQRTGARVAMMMAGPRLRVVLATNHLALREVPQKLTREQIAFVTILAARELRERWGLERPRLAVLGLNPHAGDGGIFGDEEARLIAPAIEDARAAGVLVTGPHPADGFFPQAARGACDAVVALYHDQGLIPTKLLDFRDTVNVTLGLPFPRTSPDHGTADDIAWKGIADAEPMVRALQLAARLAPQR